MTLLVAHRNPAYCRRLRNLFRDQPEYNLLDPPTTDSDLVRILGKRQPRILLLDEGFGQGSSHRLLPDLLRHSSTTKVILLAESYSHENELKAALAGAHGFLAGKTDPATLRKALKITQAGEIWIRRKTVARILNQFFQRTIS